MFRVKAAHQVFWNKVTLVQENMPGGCTWNQQWFHCPFMLWHFSLFYSLIFFKNLK